MSDPQFIPSGRPHSVEMPEGSSVAKSRSGAAGTEIRRTEQDQFAADQDIVVEAHQIVLQATEKEARGVLDLRRHDQVVRATPAHADASPNATAVPEVPMAPAAPGKPVYDTVMAEMNFPARLIKLKIDNDTVREQLQVLDALMLDAA